MGDIERLNELIEWVRDIHAHRGYLWDNQCRDLLHYLEQLKHNKYCSAAGWPCPIHCDRWSEIA